MEEIVELKPRDFPSLLSEINDPPDKLYLRGKMPPEGMKFLAVVGSRKFSFYGKEVCENLIGSLAGSPVVIVSGLALGIDGIAHKAALASGLSTVAVPGSGLSDKVLHPRTNFQLAHQILDSGGALLSEYEPNFKATPWSFPKRNRIMAGLSHATLIIEASERSGTLITARLAMEYNRDVLVVPGPILSKNHAGSNLLIKDGAHLVTSSEDILDVLDIKHQNTNSLSAQAGKLQTVSKSQLSNEERRVVEILEVEPLSKDELLERIDMSITEANILLSSMEIKGLVEEKVGKVMLK